MNNVIQVTCFTDIKDSTKLTEELGHEKYETIRNDYFRVCSALAKRNGGIVVKNTGDGHMITFADLESPLNFAVQLQQYYQPQTNFVKPPIQLRIGMFLGVVQPSDQDAFGSGVNQAARVEGKSEVGTIWINEDFLNNLTVVWGQTKVSQNFKYEGEFTIKGINQPLKLYSLSWLNYIKEYSDVSLTKLVGDCLKEASVVFQSLSIKEIANQPTIIWPVVPRNDVNTIHCGQLEIIRLLAMLGSKVHILIADCGRANNPTREYSEKFVDKLKQRAASRGIVNIEYHFMSGMISPRCEGCDIFHGHFQNVISQFTLENMQKIVFKDYSEPDKNSISKASTLDFLRPALTISSVLSLTNTIDKEKKCIVIAGFDEKSQWENAHLAIQSAPTRFGVLFNPVLKGKQGFQGRQTGDSFRYFSWESLASDMEKFELAPWLIKLPLYLSHFPEQSFTLGGKNIAPEVWRNMKNEDIEKHIDLNLLAQNIFNNYFSV